MLELGFAENTEVGKTIKKDSTKVKSSIAPHALIRTQHFNIAMCFTGYFQNKDLLLGT